MMVRAGYALLSAIMVFFWVEPLIGQTVFTVYWPFWVLLTLPTLLSFLPAWGFWPLSLVSVVVVPSVYEGGFRAWREALVADVVNVYGGALPGEPTFMLAMALIGVLVAELLRRTYPSVSFTLGLVISTIALIAYFDTWTDYEGEGVIVWAVLTGVTLLFWTALAKKPGRVASRLLSAIVLIGTLAFVTFEAPTLESGWSDFLTDAFRRDGGSGGNGVSQSGFGENDETLGGTLELTNDPVFTTRGVSARYWRVESKEIYTGKGWITASGSDSNYAPLQLYAPQVKTKPEQVLIDFVSEEPFVPYAGENARAAETEEDAAIRADETISNETFAELPGFRIRFADEEVTPPFIEVRYEVPTFTEEQLQGVQEEASLTAFERGVYLQVPGDVPNRVFELARTITAEAEGPYEQALAVQNYFRTNGFVYQTENVPYPADGEDYVDQFLFDTKYGYCDNFSTAGAVLLRSVGVPTRWVKGFAPGDARGIIQGEEEFTIRNRDAHSWIEIFIETAGWVPIEMTLSFSGTNLIDIERENVDSNTDEPTNNANETAPEAQRAPEELTDEVAVTEATGANIPFVAWLGLAFVLAVLVWNRKRLARIIIVALFGRMRLTRRHQERMHRYLLHRLEAARFHVVGRTPRELANEVDAYYETNDMSRLTDLFERSVYGQEEPNSEYKEYWKNILKRILG